MKSPRDQDVADWLAKAHDDLRVAELVEPHGLVDAVGFHAQQAAEKYLKALLVARNQNVPRTHDLERLVDECRQCGIPLPAEIDEAAMFLTPFAVLSRYPGWGSIAGSDAQRALALANEIRAFALSILAPAH